MHLKRWITGLIALPLLLFIIYKGGILLFLLIAAASLIALWEYFRIVFKGENIQITSALPLTAMAAGLGLIWAAYSGQPDLIIAIIALNLMVAGLIAIARFGRDAAVLEALKNQIQVFVLPDFGAQRRRRYAVDFYYFGHRFCRRHLRTIYRHILGAPQTGTGRQSREDCRGVHWGTHRRCADRLCD